MTDGMLKMMGVFAEMERNMISERVKSDFTKMCEISRPTLDKYIKVIIEG